MGKGKQKPGSRKGRQDCHKTEPQGYRALRCRVANEGVKRIV